MGLSLVKTTNTSVSGNYVPNCLLSGLFDLTLSGDAVIKPPSNIADGQFFAVKIGPDTVSHNLSWDDSYIGARYPDTTCDPGAYGVNIFFYFAGNSFVVNLNNAYCAL